jgi:hypothetical protein
VQVLTDIRIVYKFFEIVDSVWEDRVDEHHEAAAKFVLIPLYQLLSVIPARVCGMIQRRLLG